MKTNLYFHTIRKRALPNGHCFLIFGVILFLASCSEEEKITDPIYEFVYFKGPQHISVNEKIHSEKPFPVVAQLLAFKPYPEDITLTLEISGENAEANVDFIVLPATTLKIKAGSLISDTLFVSTIDNDAGTELERRINVKIKSVSKGDIRIGLGIQEPKNAVISISILDDECSETTAIFNTSQISNEVDWGPGSGTTIVSGTVSGEEVTLTGDLIGYPTFSKAALTLTLVTDEPGAIKGKAVFGEQETGTDDDGYKYKFVEVGEGSFDVCSGTISVEYDIYWLSGSTWVYWYSVTNTFSTQ